MAKLQLNAGAYQSRSLVAGAQRCVNLFPEKNPAEIEPEAPFTHYPRPGLIPLGAPPVQGRGRGLYRASNGDLYGVVGPSVYYINPNWQFTKLGAIENQFTPISMADNGQSNGDEIVLVDNSQLGYQINMTSRQMTQIVDTTGLFTGSTLAAFFDTFFLFNEIATNNFYCSLSEQVAFNALDIASKGTYGDPIQGIVNCQRTLWVVGAMTAEPWFDAGDPIFPLEEVFGQFVPHGTIAPYSICTADVFAFWLSQDKDGRAIMLMIEGYAAKKISTFALEDEWLTYPKLSDAICYTYQQGGHTFVVIHFPSADKSFGYDLSTEQWHERNWLDVNGAPHRERVAFHAFVGAPNYRETNVGMDWQTGQIYAVDPNTFTDAGSPIAYVRSFPHVVNELKQVTIPDVVLDMQTGTLAGVGEAAQITSPFSNGFSNGFGPLTKVSAPQIGLRISKDGGATWGNWRFKSMISAGKNRSMLRWRGNGMGRDIVVEAGWSAPMATGLNQAFFDPLEHTA
jgi:hypothetical protein